MLLITVNIMPISCITADEVNTNRKQITNYIIAEQEGQATK